MHCFLLSCIVSTMCMSSSSAAKSCGITLKATHNETVNADCYSALFTVISYFDKLFQPVIEDATTKVKFFRKRIASKFDLTF